MGTEVKILVILLLCHVEFATSTSLAEDLKITYNQKVALDKFKEIMASRLPHEYMKQDIYLIKWLRANHFDLKRAEDMLMKNIRWRAENKIDGILDEDWSDMKTEYPYYIDGIGKEGQPVFSGNFGDWDFRRAFVTGRLPRFVRYMDQVMEESAVNIRKMQEQGKNVTRWIIIENVDDFNIPQHLCPPCLLFFAQFLRSMDLHYPGYCDKVIVINAHPAVEFIFPLMRTTVSPETFSTMKVFGSNKREWQKYVLQFVDKSQIRPEFGGTKES